MTNYISLFCLLSVAGIARGSAIGLGYGYGYGLSAAPVISSVYKSPFVAPAAVSTANMVKADPIPVIRTSYIAPVYHYTAPIVTKPISVAAPITYGYTAYGYPYNFGYGLGLAKSYTLGHSLPAYGYYGYGKL